MSVNKRNTSNRNRNRPVINFEYLFHDTIVRRCDQCNLTTQQHERYYYSIPQTNRYAILVFHNIYLYQNNEFKNLLIDQFDPNLISFPSNNNNDAQVYFRIKCAVIREGDSAIAGHYIAWIPDSRTDKWIRVSDDHSRSYQNLIKNLKNVHLLFLERILE